MAKRKKDKEKKERKLYIGDFETLVYDDAMTEKYGPQEETECWACGIVPVSARPEPEDCDIYNNIYEWFNHVFKLEDNAIVFFVNLKFDGSFILDALNRLGFIQCMSMERPEHYASEWEMTLSPNSFTVCCNDMGAWYYIRVRTDDRTIEFRDLTKLLPFSVKELGKAFNTKYRKLEIEYEGERRAFGPITQQEEDYLKNDLLVPAEALYKVWFEEGIQSLTIASAALEQYKTILTKPVFDMLYPDMREVKLPIDEYPTAHDYVSASYSGGWCYLNPIARKKVFLSDDKFSNMVTGDVVRVKNSIVCDVNSLYPSRMTSDFFPVGVPEYRTGAPDKKTIQDRYCFRRFKCRFRIKPGYLPFIHIRNCPWYHPNDCLTTTDVLGKRYVRGEDTRREFIMCQTEIELFMQHYDVLNYEPIDYLSFEKQQGVFDEYIEKFRKMKIEATKNKDAVRRTLAKLFLNSLYGKMGSSLCSSYKTVRFEDDVLKFDTHIEYLKNPIYMPIAAAITSSARRFTITACQQNYFEGELRGFMYADTDSAHMVDMDADEVKGMQFDSSAFNCWDVEVSKCAVATYAKQKTYIEVATEESFEKVVDKEGNPSYNFIMKAAGLSKNGKDIFHQALLLNPGQKGKLYVNDFKPGFEMIGVNLKAKQIKGGVLLSKSDFKLS